MTLGTESIFYCYNQLEKPGNYSTSGIRIDITKWRRLFPKI